MTTVNFTVPGKPKGKQRPRITQRGRFTPSATREYEAVVEYQFTQALITDNRDYRHLPSQVKYAEVYISAYFAVPQSWSNKKKNGSYNVPYTGKPDADNIAKIILDGLNGIAFPDDACVVECDVAKRFCGRDEQPRVEVTVALECGI